MQAAIPSPPKPSEAGGEEGGPILTDLFVSHSNGQNQIPLADGNSLLIYILLALFVLLLFPLRKGNHRSPEDTTREGGFSFETATGLRGLAVIFLILGHWSFQCIEGDSVLERAGSWAVVIFLFVSGMGLTKKYGMSRLGKQFLLKRIERLLFPFWIMLAFFILLDFYLLNRTYSLEKMILGFLGILSPKSPNAPAWFITYIIYLYALLYIVSFLPFRPWFKSSIIILGSYLTTFLILHSRLWDYLEVWVEYTAVFPLAVFIGLYHQRIFGYLKSLHDGSRPIYYLLLIALFFFYYEGRGMYRLSQIWPSAGAAEIVQTIRPLSFVLCLTMLAFLLDASQYQSRLLSGLGKYSYEIYLLHFPFMAGYDFFLFRKPLLLSFFAYCLFILFLSYILQRATGALNRVVFNAAGR